MLLCVLHICNHYFFLIFLYYVQINDDDDEMWHITVYITKNMALANRQHIQFKSNYVAFLATFDNCICIHLKSKINMWEINIKININIK